MWFAALREREYSQAFADELIYLDYTGAALPALCQLQAADTLWRSAVYGNPHSENGPSRRSSAALDTARSRVMSFFHANPQEYAVIFTANASAAIKLVAESFPFGRESALVLTADNHNSVNGIREFAARSGATVRTIPLTGELRLDQPDRYLPQLSTGDRLTPPRRATPESPRGLLAYPAQSNFSGVQHSLSLIADAQSRGLRVLLDAAAFAPTSPLNLTEVQPDFVAISFYKMFGFPTGVGALIARREALAELRRPWFSGGTVEWVSVQHSRHRFRSSEEAFEDGTPNYLAIAALAAGFDLLEEVGMARVCSRVRALTDRLLSGLLSQRHPNGSAMFGVYGPRGMASRGGTVALNVRSPGGTVLAYEEVERALGARNIAVRGGCFCNPGAAEAAFDFAGPRVLSCLESASETSFTPRKFGDCLGGHVAVGALRLSVGLATDERDIDRAVAALVALAAS